MLGFLFCFSLVEEIIQMKVKVNDIEYVFTIDKIIIFFSSSIYNSFLILIYLLQV